MGDIKISNEIREDYNLDNDSELRSLLEKADPDFPIENARAEISCIRDFRDLPEPRIEITYEIYSEEDFVDIFNQTLILDPKDRKRVIRTDYD